MILTKFCIVIFIALLIWKLDNSETFNSAFNTKFQKAIINVLAILIIFTVFNYKPVDGCNNLGEKYDIYSKYLVESLLDGKVSVYKDPSPELQALENPYDPSQRTMWYSFDTAYYEGKYYVYFGVVPAILLFVPYTLITGEYLGTHIATTIFMILSIYANIALTIEIYKRWFKNLPFKMLILFIISGIISGMYVWNAWRMWLYELTLISGFFFVQLGLMLMIKATKEEKVYFKLVVLSCLSMALAVGCRPTTVFASALLLPFMYDILKRSDRRKALLSIIIPYTIVAIPLMIYNYVRFGNILEFGAKYQLTVVDVTDLSERYKDIPKGMYQYLIKFPNTNSEFPYIHVDRNTEGFTKNYFCGGMVSGILFLNITMINLVLLIKYFRKTNDNSLKFLMILLPIIGLILTVVTVYYGGSCQRYCVDFFWMFTFLSIIIWGLMYKYSSEKGQNRIFKTLLILTLITVIFNFYATFLNSEYDYLRRILPEKFEYYKELLYFIDFN